MSISRQRPTPIAEQQPKAAYKLIDYLELSTKKKDFAQQNPKINFEIHFKSTNFFNKPNQRFALQNNIRKSEKLSPELEFT